MIVYCLLRSSSLQLILRMGLIVLLSGNQAQGYDFVGPHG